MALGALPLNNDRVLRREWRPVEEPTGQDANRISHLEAGLLGLDFDDQVEVCARATNCGQAPA